MLFEDKTLNNIMEDLKNTVAGGIGTGEGTLIDHAFRGAAAEFEQAYLELAMIDQNGYAETADREHLILRAKERGIEPLPASCAVWKAEFNIDIELSTRFSSGELTYACIEKIKEREYRLRCEQSGAKGNIKQGSLIPIEYIDGFDSGELSELLIPARDEEETEAFRARYNSVITEAQEFGGNRAQYKSVICKLEGVGACKIYRVTQNEKRIKIFILDSTYGTPSAELVSDVQEIMDPLGKQGEGEGKAAIFHVVDIYPCVSETVNIEATIIMDTGYVWEDMRQDIEDRIDNYFLELAKEWENGEYITVRILKVNAAIAGVEGIVDVQDTALNNKKENLLLDPNAIPVRGVIECRD
ncbi:MAG: baseplate J/gp47 family protein [Roseburia sp.]|nr:baseplate J/gp47 family protein [Roseburia sp.]